MHLIGHFKPQQNLPIGSKLRSYQTWRGNIILPQALYALCTCCLHKHLIIQRKRGGSTRIYLTYLSIALTSCSLTLQYGNLIDFAGVYKDRKPQRRPISAAQGVRYSWVAGMRFGGRGRGSQGYPAGNWAFQISWVPE